MGEMNSHSLDIIHPKIPYKLYLFFNITIIWAIRWFTDVINFDLGVDLSKIITNMFFIYNQKQFG